MRTGHGARFTQIVLAAGIFLAKAYAQQDYVGRYEVYGGYSFLDSSNVGLFQDGFHTQVGVNLNRWSAMGFDYSWGNGTLDLTPGLLKPALQQSLGAQLTQLVEAGVIPPTYRLSVGTDATTQTFAAGPQLTYHHFSRVTLFLRPSLGAIREVAVPHPGDPVATAIVAQLVPGGRKTDWVGFYGAGGGFDLLVSKHFKVRYQVDVVYNHLFGDILENGRVAVRFSVGPSFHFGRNVP
jgi:hypothetical protein